MSGEIVRVDEARREIDLANTVPDLKAMVDKIDAVVTYMRKAGQFDLETVIEFNALRCKAVWKCGQLLEAIAPGQGARTDQATFRTSAESYKTVISEQGMSPDTAERWRVVSKMDEADLESWLAKQADKEEIPKLTDLYRIARPIDQRKSVKEAAELSGQYPVIYADPPWKYEHPPMGATGRSIEAQYPTMTLDEIKAVNVAAVASPDSVLLLWATAPKLPECLEVMQEWGFTYRTNMIWVKDKIGTGYYVRNKHELLLIGRRGEMPVPTPGTQPDSVIVAPRTGHSVKPVEFYEAIERMYPEFNGQWFELFLRGKARDGWAGGWGNEAEAA